MKKKEDETPSLVDRWWVQAVAAAWVLGVVITYFRLQLLRLLEIAQAQVR
jgi:hypothetical protein